MRVGIIGAGKMGFTLGKHIIDSDNHGLELIGYYSRREESAKEAAVFTETKSFIAMEELVNNSDMIIITVPDDQVEIVVNKLKDINSIKGKILCHTSGALSSKAFDVLDQDVFGYSAHPVFAVSSKYESYKSFGDCFITIEGNPRYIDDIKDIWLQLGHKVKVISDSDKVKYHSAAVFSSNLVIGLYHMAEELLKQCGFNEDETQYALKPLFINNAKKLYESNCESALTGPVERCDIETIDKHLLVLQDKYFEVYKILSKELIEIAENKNKDRDYSDLYKIINRNN